MKRIQLYYTDSYCGKGSHELLKRAASLYSGINADCFEVEGERGKKPYFISHPDIHFSISHSESIWICAFCEAEVGVDVQIMSRERPWEKLAGRFFCAEEADAVIRADNAADAFSEIWSRKEAVVKLFGIGIDGMFTSFSTVGDSVRFGERNVFVRDLRLDIQETHSASVACCEEFEAEIHKLT